MPELGLSGVSLKPRFSHFFRVWIKSTAPWIGGRLLWLLNCLKWSTNPEPGIGAWGPTAESHCCQGPIRPLSITCQLPAPLKLELALRFYCDLVDRHESPSAFFLWAFLLVMACFPRLMFLAVHLCPAQGPLPVPTRMPDLWPSLVVVWALFMKERTFQTPDTWLEI